MHFEKNVWKYANIFVSFWIVVHLILISKALVLLKFQSHIAKMFVLFLSIYFFELFISSLIMEYIQIGSHTDFLSVRGKPCFLICQKHVFLFHNNLEIRTIKYRKKNKAYLIFLISILQKYIKTLSWFIVLNYSAEVTFNCKKHPKLL